MTTLKKAAVANIILHVRTLGDSGLLIDRLRKHGDITPELCDLIADILEGKVKATPKRAYQQPSAAWLKLEVCCVKAMFRGEAGATAEGVALLMEAAGITQLPEKKGDITKAAEAVVQKFYGLTPAQFDERVRPRAARRKKSRENS